MAWRLYVKAERETSAQTGRLTSLWGLICIDRFAVILPFDRFAVMLPVVAMGLPERKYSVRHSCWAYRRPHWLPPERQHPPALQAEGLSDPQPPSKAQRLVLVTTSLRFFLTSRGILAQCFQVIVWPGTKSGSLGCRSSFFHLRNRRKCFGASPSRVERGYPFS